MRVMALTGTYKRGLTEFSWHTKLEIMFEFLELHIPQSTSVSLKFHNFFLIPKHQSPSICRNARAF